LQSIKFISYFRNNCIPDPADIKRARNLSEISEKLRKELDEIDPSINRIQTEIDTLQEQILEIGGVRLRSQQSIVNGLKEQIKSHQEKVTKLTVEKVTRQKSFKKLLLSIEKKQEELSDVEKKIEVVENDSTNQCNSMKAVNNRVREAEDVKEV
jgi:structural maintenance of chromosome 4